MMVGTMKRLVLVAGACITTAAWCATRETQLTVKLSVTNALEQWHVADSRASVTNGFLRLDGREARCAAFLKTPAFGDVSLSASYRVEKHDGVMAVGFVIGSTDSATYTFVHYDARSAILCQSDVTKEWREIKRSSKAQSPETWHTATLERKGNRVSVTFDGKLLYEADCAGTPGLVGFYANQTIAQIKAITVKGLSDNLAKPWVQVTPIQDWVYVCTDAGAGAYEAFPDVCRVSDGRLLAVFYAGYGHVSMPTDKLPKGGRISGCFSADEGQTWGPAFTLFDGPYDDRDPSVTQLKDGRLVCSFFTLKPKPEGQTGFDGLGSFCVTSKDGGVTWETEPRQIVKDYYCSSPIRELKDGRLSLGLYRQDRKEACGAVTFSADGGKNWCLPIDIPTGGLRYEAETDLIERQDGSLYAALRGQKHSGWSVSKDGGKTWSTATLFGFPGHCPYLHRTPDGILLMAHRLPATSLHYSLDDGKTWSENVPVDTVVGAYPSMVTLKDGSILIIYYEEGARSSIRAKRFRATRQGIEWMAVDEEKEQGTDETRIRQAPRQQNRAELLWTKVLCKEPGRYIGWPTVCARKSGELLAVFSGDRDEHVCPFGKVQMIRSNDQGGTWTPAVNISNTDLDDRDAGIVEMLGGDLVASWFTSLAYQGSIRDRNKLVPGTPRFYWWLHDEKIPDAVKKDGLGYFTIRSSDGGKTWEAPVRTPGTAPHGPIVLKDGRLLFVGITYSGHYGIYSGSTNEITVAESRDQGRSWQRISAICLPAGELTGEFHEPHAVETADGRIVAQIRHDKGTKLWQSESGNGGKTWTTAWQTQLTGLPPHLIRLRSGKLLTVYGRRFGAFGEYACVSDDHGRTWDVANEIKLAGHFNGDLGYPASAELPDGCILTVYYQADRRGEKTCLMGTKWKLTEKVEGP